MDMRLSWKQRVKAFFCGKLQVDVTEIKTDFPVNNNAAKQLLKILQKQGRLLDFLTQNIDQFNDKEVANAAKVVHRGCNRALKKHCIIKAIYDTNENTNITLNPNFDRSKVNLTGNHHIKSPIKGILIHKGWQIESLSLPTLTEKANPDILQPAEIEVR